MTPLQHTRRVYHFDRLLLSEMRKLRGKGWETVNRAMASCRFSWRHQGVMRNILRDVWRLEAPIHLRAKPPALEFREGETAYALGRRLIVLVPEDCTGVVLIHEIAHSLGYGAPHGEFFAGRHMAMLVRHLGVPEELVISCALTVGLRFRRSKTDYKRQDRMLQTVPRPEDI